MQFQWYPFMTFINVLRLHLIFCITSFKYLYKTAASSKCRQAEISPLTSASLFYLIILFVDGEKARITNRSWYESKEDS